LFFEKAMEGSGSPEQIFISQRTDALFVWLISHQPAVLFSQNKPATSNQPAVLFSQNKPAPAITHQPTEQAESLGAAEAPIQQGNRRSSKAKLHSQAAAPGRTGGAWCLFAVSPGTPKA
jgi:hypothetical protein